MISKKGVGDFLERSESPDGYKKAPHNGGASCIFYNDCYLTFGVGTFPFSFSF